MFLRKTIVLIMPALAVALVPLAMLAGCDSGESPSAGGTGTLRVHMTDDPFSYSYVASARVDISAVYARSTSGTTVTVMDRAATLDLVQLRNGLTSLLGEVRVPVGQYDQIRLIVEQAEVTLTDGRVFDLKVPSGDTSGLKIFLSPALNVTEDGVVDALLDFDLARSFVATGGGSSVSDISGFNFKPVIRGTMLSGTGSLAGTVKSDNATPASTTDDSALSGALVTVMQNGEVLMTAVSDTAGFYKMIALNGGSYDLTVSAMGHNSKSLIGVSIAGGEESRQDVLLEMLSSGGGGSP